uniref:Uncharacterized protein n=1 Tax=Rhizophora mucronata TaxID=61149 RepID=A0A2P2M3T0_RHIMU
MLFQMNLCNPSLSSRT